MRQSATLDARLAELTGTVEMENRRARRVAFRHDCVKIESINGAGVTGFVAAFDLSRGGVGLISEGVIKTGSIVLVALHRPDGKSDRLAGRVAHCRSFAGQWYSIGVRFEREIDVRAYLQE